MYSILEDEDDIFMGSPKSKFFDIIYNANRGLVEQELERVYERHAAMEMLLEESLGDELEHKIKAVLFEKSQEIDAMTKSLYMESTAKVVTNNE